MSNVAIVAEDGCLLVDVRLLFFFNDTATTEIYTLSLHDALPILTDGIGHFQRSVLCAQEAKDVEAEFHARSEEHTSELQSQSNLLRRLLLENNKAEPNRARLPCLLGALSRHRRRW